ncbi:MAG TPA: MBL fold metallo-hydrolase [Blastocatellia bacterium]|nr:MBL fold metallo-hydrolase [Blastocatellia bacterium]
MTKKWLIAVSFLTLLSWAVFSGASGAQDPKASISAASKALGAENLKSIEYTGSGFDYVLGQAANPTLPWPKFNDKAYTRIVDLEAPASHMHRIRTQGENPPRGGGLQPIVGEQTQDQVIAAGSPQAADLQNELMTTLPYSFLRSAAAASDATVKSQSMNGKKYTVLSFTGPNKATVRGFFTSDNLLERIETKIDNTVLGDIPSETTLTDYKDFNGVKFPTHIVQKQGSYPVFDLTVTDVKPNPVANITSPPGKGGAAGGGAPQTASSEKLGDGVYLILGGYAAIAVDFKDYIVIIEGGQNDQRTEAVIGEAKRLIPNKPIQYVINTHQHFDHSGGLRAYVAEGATVVTQQINKPYYEKIWTNPHTIAPDKLSRNPKKPKFETVADKKVMTDGNQVIELYHLRDFGHNDGMLIAYLPKLKILLEADGFNPPAQPATQRPATISPYTASLQANIERLKLDVERIIPVHYPADSRKVMNAELLTATGKGS